VVIKNYIVYMRTPLSSYLVDDNVQTIRY